jgi:hypothetical protein
MVVSVVSETETGRNPKATDEIGPLSASDEVEAELERGTPWSELAGPLVVLVAAPWRIVWVTVTVIWCPHESAMLVCSSSYGLGSQG